MSAKLRAAVGVVGLSALIAGLGVPPSAQAVTSLSIAAVNGATFTPVLHVRTPWKDNRGSISTGYSVSLPALIAPQAAAAGTDVNADIPGMTAEGAGLTIRGAYGWLSCATPLPTANAGGHAAYPDNCTVVQSHPTGAVTLANGHVTPVNGVWRNPAANGVLFNVNSALRLTSDMVGRYVYLQYFAQTLDAAGASPDGTDGITPALLVMPANTSVTSASRIDTAAPVAGQTFTAQGATWPAAAAGTAAVSDVSSVWACANQNAATDPGLGWDVTNGCTRVIADTALASGNRTLTGTVPANAAGKYLVVNNTINTKPVNATSMPGNFATVSRSAAVLIAAAPGAAPVASDAPSAGPSAAPNADASAAGPAANGSATSNAPADTAGGGAAQAAGGADLAALAAGAGVNLAKAPLVNAAGAGTGASSKLKMQLAASKKVNRGRYITMKAVVSPKSSAGRVRIALVRTNAKGKVISSKAIYAPIKKGVASKRWQIPKSYTPANFTLIATYEPAKKGAPGVTATAPVTIG